MLALATTMQYRRLPIFNNEESFFSNIVDGVIEGDRRKMRRHTIKYASFVSAILSCLCAESITVYSLYRPLFLKYIKYTQYQVNTVSTTAELAIYLPVPLFGYLYDRYNIRSLSLAADIIFRLRYLLAALAYYAGPPELEGGWPFAIIVIAFIGVGSSTAYIYLSIVTTCAKYFGKGKYQEQALAILITAFRLSRIW